MVSDPLQTSMPKLRFELRTELPNIRQTKEHASFEMMTLRINFLVKIMLFKRKKDLSWPDLEFSVWKCPERYSVKKIKIDVMSSWVPI